MLSLEPKPDGLVDVFVGTVKTAVLGRVRFVVDASCVRVCSGQSPLETLDRFEQSVENWIGSLPSEVWIAALHDRLPPIMDAYGPLSDAGRAVSQVFEAFGTSERLAEPATFSHGEFASLVKFAVAFAAPFPAGSTLRVAVLNLRAAMIQATATDPIFANPYKRGLL